jgi:hypothetical protein
MAGFPSESFVMKVEARLRESPEGRQLLQRLEEESTRKPLILIFLQLYCGAQVESPTRDAIRDYRSPRQTLADKLDKFAEHLLEDVAEMKNINSEAAPQLARHGLQPFSLPDRISSYISQLKAASEELSDVSLRKAPMDALNIIADCMKGSDGEVNSGDMELLLSAGYKAFGVTKDLTAEDIRHLLARARDRRNQRSGTMD